MAAYMEKQCRSSSDSELSRASHSSSTVSNGVLTWIWMLKPLGKRSTRNLGTEHTPGGWRKCWMTSDGELWRTEGRRTGWTCCARSTVAWWRSPSTVFTTWWRKKLEDFRTPHFFQEAIDHLARAQTLSFSGPSMAGTRLPPPPSCTVTSSLESFKTVKSDLISMHAHHYYAPWECGFNSEEEEDWGTCASLLFHHKPIMLHKNAVHIWIGRRRLCACESLL